MKLSNVLLFLSLSFFLASCQNGSQKEGESETATEPETSVHNTLTEAEIADGWRLLFDGKTTAGWRVFKSDTIRGWEVKDGELIALGEAGPEGEANDIITNDQFENFELSLEWKVSPQANSGIFFNVVEEEPYKTVYATGPEYQIVDDLGWPGGLLETQRAGANYDMHAPAKKVSKPAGEYNQARIAVKDGHVEHWLNGEKIVEYQLWTPEWEELVKNSKWKDFPGYGQARKGHIALQDHGNIIWFRNIKIREL
jgi:hypothetical protein